MLLTTLFFWVFCCSLRSSYKELIGCTNHPNAQLLLSVSTEVLLGGAFLRWVSLTLASGNTVLQEKDAFLILVLPTKNGYPSFLKKVFVFQKICFKVEVMKTFKFSTDCHIKHADLPNGGLFLKSLALFFRRIYALSVSFKMKPLRKIVFLC